MEINEWYNYLGVKKERKRSCGWWRQNDLYNTITGKFKSTPWVSIE